MQVNTHTAKSQLSKLIEAALNGDEVVITRGDTPVVRLVAIEREPAPFPFGALEGRLGEGPDLLAPMPEAELLAWEGDGTDDPGRAPGARGATAAE